MSIRFILPRRRASLLRVFPSTRQNSLSLCASVVEGSSYKLSAARPDMDTAIHVVELDVHAAAA